MNPERTPRVTGFVSATAWAASGLYRCPASPTESGTANAGNVVTTARALPTRLGPGEWCPLEVATPATVHATMITITNTYMPNSRKRSTRTSLPFQGQSENTSAWMWRGLTPMRLSPRVKPSIIGGGQHT